MAKRIQRKRTKGYRLPDGAIYVGRPTKWGNPYRHGDPLPGMPDQTMDVEDAVHWFAILIAPTLPLEELRGHDLACWCPLDRPCHADVLLRLANQ